MPPRVQRHWSRRSFLVGSAALLGGSRLRAFAARAVADQPRPTAAQLAWQRDERAMFLHFGVNTFTDREWGDGREDPALFAPGRLDAREWARVARAAGFRAMVLTAKHHDGFCLWPTRTTTHSVAASPWRAGQGDLVREFVEGCRAEGLRPGLYLSPWDRNHPAYGDSARYNDVYGEQLTELLAGYGPIAEVWFDGANGEGPNGRKQVYDWPRFWGLVRRLQPGAVIFSDAGPDVRWCGNEAGLAGEPNWSTVDPDIVPVPGAAGPGVAAALQHGDPDGTVWRPAECDTSIRPGWFHHPAEDARVRSVDELVDLYVRSVGRNGKLLLNVPPTRDGVLPPTDTARLSAFGARLESVFAHDLAEGRTPSWTRTGARTAVGEIDFGRTVSIAIVRLEESIEAGQVVARHVLSGFSDGEWRELARGTTIGYAKLIRLAQPTPIRRLRVDVRDAVPAPAPLAVKGF